MTPKELLKRIRATNPQALLDSPYARSLSGAELLDFQAQIAQLSTIELAQLKPLAIAGLSIEMESISANCNQGDPWPLAQIIHQATTTVEGWLNA